MAKEVIIRIKDDLDDTLLADKTITFAYDGASYEIDLTAAHADEFEADMTRWIKAGRVVVPEKPLRKTRQKDKRSTTYVKPENRPGFDQRQRVRAWASQVGYEVYAKGQIGADIVQAYAKTHPDEVILPETWPSIGRIKKFRKRPPSTESVVAQDGSEQSVHELFESRREMARQGARTAHERGLESGRFGLSKELRDKIRLWAVEQKLDQALTGQLKTATVDAYFKAHPGAGDDG